MGFAVDLDQSGRLDLGIALRRGKRSVAEQFLDRPKIATGGKQVGREAVP
jgi:hypothetical protein